MEIKRHHAFLDKEMERMLKHKELAAQAAKQVRRHTHTPPAQQHLRLGIAEIGGAAPTARTAFPMVG